MDRAHSGPTFYRQARATKDARVRLIVDHAVPLRMITGMMFRSGFNRTREGVLEHLARWYRLGVLLADEDKLLNTAGLRSKMPDSWDGHNPFARYEAVGITGHRQHTL